MTGGKGQGSGAGQLNSPNGVFVDKEGNLWVADPDNGRVQKFAPGSTSGETIGANLPNAPQTPYGIFVRRNGEVYVTDYWKSRVVRLDSKCNQMEDCSKRNVPNKKCVGK